MAKRKYAEVTVENLEELSPASNVTVHGALTHVSPVKRGKRSIYFDGGLADTTCSRRLFGFLGGQQQKLQDYSERRVAVEIANCEITPSRTGDGVDIMLKHHTTIRESGKELDVDAILVNYDPPPSNTPTNIKLIEVPNLELFVKVKVRVKAVKVNQPVRLIEKTKQDIIVADGSATARLTVWEDNIGAMEEGRSYELNSYVIRIYQSTKYLSRGEDSTLLQIEDLGPVARPDVEDEIVYKNVIISGVPKLSTHKCCIKCKGRVEPESCEFGACKECNMPQRLEFCNELTTAQIIISHKAGEVSKMAHVNIIGIEMLRRLCGTKDDAPITQETLLGARKISTVTVARDTKIVTECSVQSH